MSELNQDIRQSPDYVDGGIVWEEEKSVGGAPLLCTQWGGLEARCGQVPGPTGVFYFAQFGRFESGYAAKMFAERVLTDQFKCAIQSGEAQPMEGHAHLAEHPIAAAAFPLKEPFSVPPATPGHEDLSNLPPDYPTAKEVSEAKLLWAPEKHLHPDTGSVVEQDARRGKL